MLPAMPQWALGLACASLLFSWNAHSPVRRLPRGAVVSFFAGWIASELPLWHLAIQVALALALIATGALDSFVGYAALAVFALSWLGLWRCHVRQNDAGHRLSAALSDLSAGASTALALSPPEALRALVPVPPAAPIEHLRDIVYAEEAGVRLRLDLRRPREGQGPLPVLLQIHGGAWIVGNKEQQGVPLVTHMAARGWACVSINYRLAPRATFPAAIVDVKRAIAWVRAHAEAYGLDPRCIVLTGGSAGGHLSSLAALTANDPALQPGFESVDTSVAGCVPFYGVYDFTDRFGHWPNRGLIDLLERFVLKAKLADARADFDRASPLSHVRADAPPFFVIHGDKDSLVPVDDARAFVLALRAVSRSPVAYAELPGAQHAFDVFLSVRTALVIRGVERFLEQIAADVRRA